MGCHTCCTPPADCELRHQILHSHDQELLPSEEYSLALWIRRFRRLRLSFAYAIQLLGLSSLEVIGSSSVTLPLGTTASSEPKLSHYSNGTVSFHATGVSPLASVSEAELLTSKLMYWVLVPILQLVGAMILADSLQ